MFILHDPNSGMGKPSYMIKYFQIDAGKRFVNFHCRTKSFYKASTFIVLIFQCDISECRNARKMVFSVSFQFRYRTYWQ